MTNKILKQLNDTEYGQNIRKEFNDKVDKDTVKYQKQYSFNMGTGKEATHNNEADAFKHAYMQAVLFYQANKWAGQKAGNFASKTLGDFHEDETEKQPLNERNMDLWNNEVGREVARDIIKKLGPSAYTLPEEEVENFFAKEIVDRIKKGDLITKTQDQRQFKDRYKYNQTISKPNGQYNFGKKGHWVTVHGHHVCIEDEK